MRTTIGINGQIVLPTQARAHLRVVKGSVLTLECVDGAVVIRPLRATLDAIRRDYQELLTKASDLQ